MNYYVYAYLREDGSPYYVGKGVGNRINQKWFHRVSIPPRNRRVKLYQNLSADEAESKEIEMIRHFGRKCDGGLLANITIGGVGFAGGKHTEETKRKWVGRKVNRRAVVNIQTGEVYKSMSEAAVANSVSPRTIYNHCNNVTEKQLYRYDK